jgi:hypothetical protein
MRKLILVAGLAAAALVPSLAFAQQSCQQQHDNQAFSTVAGAGIGALVGSAIAPRGDRTAGAVIGGVSGAVIANQVSRPNEDCAHAYGYYDRNNLWHANSIDRSDARGYYDRDGVWIEGAPNGYYDSSGRWVTAGRDATVSGYYDSRGRWVPAYANGYYDETGQWVASVSGYYDTSGRWISGPASGAYDANGHWIAGARSGHQDANGVWIADAQPGYYDSNHHWRVGPTQGYYDTRGQWIAATPSAGANGADTSFDGRYDRRDVDSREAWLEQRIQSAAADGSLSRYERSREMRMLSQIRSQETGMRARNGQLSARDEARLQSRLDDLSTALRTATNAPTR